jgi:long-chain acyl-CoA synthetase
MPDIPGGGGTGGTGTSGAAFLNGAWTVARLERCIEARGDAAAILWFRDGDINTWSCKDLAEMLRRLATGLREGGLASGEPVVINGPNAPQWIAIALAVNVAGGLVVPVDDLATDESIKAIISDSKARWIFTTCERLAFLRSMSGAAPLRLYVLNESDGLPSEVSWLRLRAEMSVSLPEPRPDQSACLFYTSGTTGAPKAVVLTHENIGANVQALAAEDLAGPGDRALVPLPLHHPYPYVVGMLAALESGAAVVLPESASGSHVLQALRKARITVSIGVPRLYEALLGGLMAHASARGRLAEELFSILLLICTWFQRRLALALGRWLLRPVRRRLAPDLRLLVSGGAMLDAELSWRLAALGWEVLVGYGLAETGAAFTANLPRRKRMGSVGRPIANGEVRISYANEAGVGEIELRGRNVARGYYNNPEASLAAFSSDGWLRTGDLGYLDRDGFLFVTGRTKEVIVLGGGKKVNPEDVESIYAPNPVIAEIAILERAGQLVALVRPDLKRLHEMGTLNVDQAIRVALEEIAQGRPGYERLTGFAIATRPLPRTSLGKYRRFLLPDLYDQIRRGHIAPARASELSMEDRQLLANPIASLAWDIVSKRYAERQPTLDAHLALDLGIDSLEWMALSLELEEKLKIALLPEVLAAVETARDLVVAVGQANARRTAESPTRERRMLADREYWLRSASPTLTLIALALLGLNKIFMRGVFRLRSQGLEHLPPKGPLLLVSNHVSDLDPFALAAALPFGCLRQAYWAGDVVRLFSGPARRLLCRAMRVYPVDERVPAAAIDMASCVLSRGNIQVWFPEGWRSPDGKLQRFLPGIGTLAATTRAPAAAVYISGSFRAMPRTRRWPRLYPIRVLVGAPLGLGTLEARGRGNTTEERVTNALQAEIRALASAVGEDV